MKSTKRSDYFFGLHNDFHAKPEEGLVVGATLEECDIREICENLRPGFIQIDCKGHPGWTSYPSALGNAMPHFKGDPLSLWRKVTKEYGVKLYVHYSGVYDTKYCEEHPDERVMKADGSYRASVRLDSKYFDELFIPQLSELAEKYGVDGVWVDGDCWAVALDYRPETISKFEQTLGINLNGNPPKSKDDPYFNEFLDFTREQYRAVLRHYIDVLHSKYPDFEICSNWAFSDQMPEEVCADVDFLSGDLNPYQSFNSSRYAARMICQHGLHWDLMAWNFRHRAFSEAVSAPKHPTQIMQEAASVISLGGGFQDYVMQHNDGSPNMVQIRNLLPVAEFLRQREPYCFKGKPIHQAVMLVSTFDRYHQMNRPFNREGMEKYIGLISLLCDSGVSLETAFESTLKKNLREYPLVVVPEIYHDLPDDIFEDLKEYVQQGGNLCIVGSKTAMLFSDKGFGFTASYFNEHIDAINNATVENGHNNPNLESSCLPYYFSLDGNTFGATLGGCKIETAQGNPRVPATLHTSMRASGVPCSSVFTLGRGTVSVIGIDLGTQYYKGAQFLHRVLIKNTILTQFSPLAKIESAVGTLELTCLSKDNRLMLQLVNANGNHNDPVCLTEEQIPPVVDIVVSVGCDKKPKEILLQPDGKKLAFTFKDGRAYVNIARVDIHSILEVIF